MKRLIAVSFALIAASAFAGNSQYSNDAGEQDQHQPQVADAGSLGNEEQSFPQVG
jgi:hypothetical protein